MITLVPLFSMTLRLVKPLDVGDAPIGRRIVAEIAGAEISGRLSGALAGSSRADWFTRTVDGLGLPDVRIAICTDDNALILMGYFEQSTVHPKCGVDRARRADLRDR